MAQEKKSFDYDPMIYDIMKETSYHLGGEFIALARRAGTAEEREAFWAAQAGVESEADMVDFNDEAAVKAKTEEFSKRIRAINSAAKRRGRDERG